MFITITKLIKKRSSPKLGDGKEINVQKKLAFVMKYYMDFIILGFGPLLNVQVFCDIYISYVPLSYVSCLELM